MYKFFDIAITSMTIMTGIGVFVRVVLFSINITIILLRAKKKRLLALCHKRLPYHILVFFLSIYLFPSGLFHVVNSIQCSVSSLAKGIKMVNQYKKLEKAEYHMGIVQSQTVKSFHNNYQVCYS
jgi:hypothetical protein